MRAYWRDTRLLCPAAGHWCLARGKFTRLLTGVLILWLLKRSQVDCLPHSPLRCAQGCSPTYGSGEGVKQVPPNHLREPKLITAILSSSLIAESVPFFIPWSMLGIILVIYQKYLPQLCSMCTLSYPIILNLERILEHLKQDIFGKAINPTLQCWSQKNALELLYVQFLRLPMCAGFILLTIFSACHSYCHPKNQLESIQFNILIIPNHAGGY